MASSTSIPSGWIDGEPHHATGADHIVVNPATDEPVATVKLAGRADVDAAVAGARAAQPAWGRATPAERASVLLALARAMAAESETLISEEVAHTGKAVRLATEFDVPGSIDNVEFFAGVARNLEGKATAEYSADHTSSIRREPVGVVGTITPWNYPLQMAVWKVIPALAAGCAVVLKPAEITPLTTLTLARLASEAGLPDGVLNIVVGTGPEVGAHLAGHPGVDMVTFTGSSAVGRQVMAQAATTGARIQLELGGKAPFVVFDDADLDAAIHGAVAGSLINGGQDCTAATRAIVAPALYDDFVAGVAELMSKVVIGDPTDPATDLGSLISHAHRDKVAGMVDRARASGARIVTGGTIPDGPGAFYPPTLVADVAEDSEIYRDEVFGPVLTVSRFTDDDDAIRRANDTPYGLAASAWTRDVYRAQRASREIHAGCVWINDHIPIISEMPHGGFKASGFGKDMSTYSLEEYLLIKHVMSDLHGVVEKEWHRTVFGLGSDQG
ncbi:gamma-aminobutyraldehyde dehydrogenase [Gordonia paraffinivorans]|uniref:Gamma-aminobutyraldehyde dehydrogenase n=1 Tax=Gordonia paraffinivorans TaxID=175628 RepID=A0ABD7V853_9ACTN|nr:gamma-aminobutyraldehyde dehydrogenase [Gordonia paraffinivorans]MCD2146135.1 gamma-aminobutyraldehyde dehydrogenase [Gordonia paraffinivorans]VFA90389.1 Gamma-aminobutyraldehyde dehydrogenase [Gordonia paraffinivorans]